MAENINVPGVFRGSQKLATETDISILRQEFRRLLAGPISEISQDGYIPWKYNPDGTLDIEYLFPELIKNFEENTGISIRKNGIIFKNNIKTINFTGNYVHLDIDQDDQGKPVLVLDIRPPKQEVSRFNDIDGITNSLVKIKNDIISGMIIPDLSDLTDNPICGDWPAGSIQEGFNWNKSEVYDPLILYTDESVFASNLESYFEIFIFNSSEEEVFDSVITKSICGNTRDGDYLGAQSRGEYARHINVIIKNFKEENNGFSFKPIFNINLIGIVGKNGGRFHIKIIHNDGIFHNTYISKDFFYNVGKIPTIANHSYQIINDKSSINYANTFTWCSGLKYITNGSILLNVNEITDLNTSVAVEDKYKYEFSIANQNASIENSTLENYTLKLDTNPTLKIMLHLNKETFLNNETSGFIVVRNAFGESDPYYVSIPLLLDSRSTLKKSDCLNEYFSDETYRLSNRFETLSNGVDIAHWDSGKSLADSTYEHGAGLMVVPGEGLRYPYGDWSNYIPTGSGNYDTITVKSTEKFYSRMFIGRGKYNPENPEVNIPTLKFGGMFEFKGLTKEEFLDQRISCIISCDKGLSWFSIKHVRNERSILTRMDGSELEITGILTHINEIENGVQVFWAYPGTLSSENPIYFKLGMKPASPFIIKSISLRNLDGTEDW